VTKDILFTFLHNRTDEWRAVEEHAVVAVVVVLFTYLLPPMQPPLTQSLVVHFLDLRSNTSNTWITQRWQQSLVTTVTDDNSHWWQQPLMTTCHWCGFFSLKTLSSVPSAAELRIFFTSEKPRCDQKIKEKTSTLPIKPAYYCSATEQPMLAVATNWRLTAVELKLNAAKGGLYNTVGQSRKAVD